jgi:hypothetical protein
VFLLALVLVLLGLARRWPGWVLAVLAGAATAVRPVGVAATAAVVASVLSDPERGPPRRRAKTAAWVAALGCWGLLAFMAHLLLRYADPLAFATAQRHWAFHAPGPNDPPSKWLRLATAEPIWNAYVPGSSRYWAAYELHGVGALGIQFWNPILFVLAAAAVAVGWRNGWLNRPEVVLGLGLLLVPYLTRADETCMGSQARFAAVVVPAFVVLGRGLARLRPGATWAVFAALGAALAVWTALFAAGWPMC